MEHFQLYDFIGSLPSILKVYIGIENGTEEMVILDALRFYCKYN